MPTLAQMTNNRGFYSCTPPLSASFFFWKPWASEKSRPGNRLHQRQKDAARSVCTRITPELEKKARPGRPETQFSCIFCNHEKSVSCKIDKKDGIGHLLCKICGQSFQTRAHRTFLSPSNGDAIGLISWVDIRLDGAGGHIL